MPTLKGKEWEDVSKQIDIVLDKIFQNDNWKRPGNPHEKRKKVFDYLKNKTKHDNYLFNKIQKNKDKIKRNMMQEMFSVIEDNNGISNGIAQAYKLLLDRLGIYSMVVFGTTIYGKDNIGSLIRIMENPNDMKAVKKFLKQKDGKGITIEDHMFNLVQNMDGTFSFDDVTFAVLNKEKGDLFFDYDMIKSYEFAQSKIKGMPSIILNMNIGKDEILVEEKIAECKLDRECLVPLPKNIKKYS